jgi:hypothetical protein
VRQDAPGYGEAVSDRVTALRRAWLKAADDLGIRVAVQSGVAELPCAVLVEDFGASKGTLLWPDEQVGRVRHDLATEEGFYWSFVGDSYESYDRDFFIDTLNDLGWFGAGQPPHWYTGEYWGEAWDRSTERH